MGRRMIGERAVGSQSVIMALQIFNQHLGFVQEVGHHPAERLILHLGIEALDGAIFRPSPRPAPRTPTPRHVSILFEKSFMICWCKTVSDRQSCSHSITAIGREHPLWLTGKTTGTKSLTKRARPPSLPTIPPNAKPSNCWAFLLSI